MDISSEDFSVMVHQLLYQEPISYDKLCEIAIDALKPAVARWCWNDDCLRGRGYEKDLLQDILELLMNKTVSMFLLRSGEPNQVNYDPEGFRSWMFTVASNARKDFAARVRRVEFHTTGLVDIPEDMPQEESEDRVQRLREALNTVLEADVSVYKTLTWLAQFIFVLGEDVDKVRSSQAIEAVFRNKTLDEMYGMLTVASRKIPWLELSASQKERIEAALERPFQGQQRMGDRKYSQCFMKKGGKKSISDWVNRLNTIVRRSEWDESSNA